MQYGQHTPSPRERHTSVFSSKFAHALYYIKFSLDPEMNRFTLEGKLFPPSNLLTSFTSYTWRSHFRLLFSSHFSHFKLALLYIVDGICFQAHSLFSCCFNHITPLFNSMGHIIVSYFFYLDIVFGSNIVIIAPMILSHFRLLVLISFSS